MKWKMNLNAVNQFSKGMEIYSEGETVSSVALVLKGRILIQNSGAKYIVNSGFYLGVNDLYEGSYQSTYTALDDGILYVFSADRSEDLDSILTMNKDYHGLMVASLNRTIKELDNIYQVIIKQGAGLYQFIKKLNRTYEDIARLRGYSIDTVGALDSLVLMDNSDLEPESDRIAYYKECATLPMDVVKTYFSYGNAISLYQVQDQSMIINRQIEVLKEHSMQLSRMAELLIDESNNCLFHRYAALAIEIENQNGSNKELVDQLDHIIEKINEVENFFERLLGSSIEVNRKRMEEAYHLLLTGTKSKEMSVESCLKYTGEDTQTAIEELSDSFSKLLKFSELDQGTVQSMTEDMSNFINRKDRFSSEGEARSLRKKLTDNHYILYQAIFLKAYKEKSVPRIVDLFLKYSYADERLLPKEQLLELYFMQEDEPSSKDLPIYNIKEWLTLIYEGKKQPSKNEFDQEYPDMLATLKRQGKYSEKELRELEANPEKRLEFEIQNMFRYNHKTTNGQISTFVPVLHREMMVSGFDKAIVTKNQIVEAMNAILRIDYSIFDREVLYADKERGIVKEYIIKKVSPDIVLMPTVGSNGIMWQEISGKKRDSSARFLLPAFCDGNLVSILVKVFGRFRWEMCRTIEGSAWNDIKLKSLTSEYSDYLQFYRKNRELSEEKKEKLKLQIQRGRSSREIFVIDYEQWINFEAIGAIKLNKIVRELMATYCPFAKPIRDQLISQPLFEEAMTRYNREKSKKIREIESRHRYLQKEQIELTQVLLDTLAYYKEN